MTAERWEFFVSYTQADQAWAEWIAWELEESGHRVLVQAWDFVPGSNWVQGMQDGVVGAERTIAVLSPAYLESVYGAVEWQAAFRDDPDGRRRKLLAVRVADCERPGILGSVVGVDLFAVPETTARTRLRDTVARARHGRAKPDTSPPFPSDRAITREPRFPGASPRPTPPSADAVETRSSEESKGTKKTEGAESTPSQLATRADPGKATTVQASNSPRRRLFNKRTLTVGGTVATAGLLIAALSLARDVTDYKIDDQPSGTPTTSSTTGSIPLVRETQVIYERPWGGNGDIQPTLTVAGRYTANCISSLESDDPEALRCFSENPSYVSDPCWPDGAIEAAVCPGDPWSTEVTLLYRIDVDATARAKIRDQASSLSTTPWALELENGQRCVSEAGATGVVAGMRINYLCNNETGQAIGELDKRDRLWRILFSGPGSAQVTYVNVARVWA